jgi:hypothetical protein
MAKKAAEGLTIAFFGTGAMDVDNATDLIEEFIEATIQSDDDSVRFVFPLTSPEFSETLGELVEMAKQSDITYECITQSGDTPRQNFNDIAGTAAKTYHVEDVYLQMERILTEAPVAILEVLWDQSRDDEMTRIVWQFIKAGIEVRDLTDGNTPVDIQWEEEEPTQLAETDESEEPADDAEVLTRAELTKMSWAEIKEIAASLGLPPRKSSAAMINEIMGPDEEAAEVMVTPEEDEEPSQVTEVEMIFTNPKASELVQILDQFPGRIHDVLDQFLTSLATTVEGLVFNGTPEEHIEKEEHVEKAKPARRLTTRAR